MTYTYDGAGNRETANGDNYGETGPYNRLTTDDTYTYKYDANGNLTGKFKDTGSVAGQLDNNDVDVTQYSWDSRLAVE